MSPEQRFDALQVGLWSEYRDALRALGLAAREGHALRDDDLLHLLRPFLWWLHAPGFQDLYDRCDRARDALALHPAHAHPAHPQRPFWAALALFLSRYLDEGLHDPTALPPPLHFGSPELAMAGIARELAPALRERGSPDGADALLAVAADFEDVEALKHDAVAALRVFGAQRLDALAALIHDLPEDGQAHVLRALEGNAGHGVRAFFDAYIERTPDDALREAARARRGGA